MGIKIKPANKGLLHAKMSIPQGESIPLKALLQAKNSSSPALRKEATFAKNARSFKHK